MDVSAMWRCEMCERWNDASLELCDSCGMVRPVGAPFGGPHSVPRITEPKSQGMRVRDRSRDYAEACFDDDYDDVYLCQNREFGDEHIDTSEYEEDLLPVSASASVSARWDLERQLLFEKNGEGGIGGSGSGGGGGGKQAQNVDRGILEAVTSFGSTPRKAAQQVSGTTCVKPTFMHEPTSINCLLSKLSPSAVSAPKATQGVRIGDATAGTAVLDAEASKAESALKAPAAAQAATTSRRSNEVDAFATQRVRIEDATQAAGTTVFDVEIPKTESARKEMQQAACATTRYIDTPVQFLQFRGPHLSTATYVNLIILKNDVRVFPESKPAAVSSHSAQFTCVHEYFEAATCGQLVLVSENRAVLEGLRAYDEQRRKAATTLDKDAATIVSDAAGASAHTRVCTCTITYIASLSEFYKAVPSFRHVRHVVMDLATILPPECSEERVTVMLDVPEQLAKVTGHNDGEECTVYYLGVQKKVLEVLLGPLSASGVSDTSSKNKNSNQSLSTFYPIASFGKCMHSYASIMTIDLLYTDWVTMNNNSKTQTVPPSKWTHEGSSAVMSRAMDLCLSVVLPSDSQYIVLPHLENKLYGSPPSDQARPVSVILDPKDILVILTRSLSCDICVMCIGGGGGQHAGEVPLHLRAANVIGVPFMKDVQLLLATYQHARSSEALVRLEHEFRTRRLQLFDPYCINNTVAPENPVKDAEKIRDVSMSVSVISNPKINFGYTNLSLVWQLLHSTLPWTEDVWLLYTQLLQQWVQSAPLQRDEVMERQYLLLANDEHTDTGLLDMTREALTWYAISRAPQLWQECSYGEDIVPKTTTGASRWSWTQCVLAEVIKTILLR